MYIHEGGRAFLNVVQYTTTTNYDLGAKIYDLINTSMKVSTHTEHDRHQKTGVNGNKWTNGLFNLK